MSIKLNVHKHFVSIVHVQECVGVYIDCEVARRYVEEPHLDVVEDVRLVHIKSESVVFKHKHLFNSIIGSSESIVFELEHIKVFDFIVMETEVRVSDSEVLRA